MIIKKTYRLSEKNVEILKVVMEKEGLGSENKAIEFIISDYQKRNDLRSDIVKIIRQEMEELLTRIKWSTTATEKNTLVLLDMVNTQIMQEGISELNHIGYDKSSIMEESEKIIEEELGRKKQARDHRAKKIGGSENV